jgi:hypothetical protein
MPIPFGATPNIGQPGRTAIEANAACHGQCRGTESRLVLRSAIAACDAHAALLIVNNDRGQRLMDNRSMPAIGAARNSRSCQIQ